MNTLFLDLLLNLHEFNHDEFQKLSHMIQKRKFSKDQMH